MDTRTGEPPPGESPPGEPPPGEAPPGESRPSDPGPAAPPQVSPSPPATACEVLLHLEVQERDSLRTLRVSARNLSGEPLTFDVPERCPNGLIDFEGLGAGYDYYGTCNAGACAGWGPTRRITLAEGASQPIAVAHVDTKGRAPCTNPIPPGRYAVRPVPPKTTVNVCVEGAVLEVPAPLPPEQVAAASKDPYWCQDSSECVLSCPGAEGCCGYPCGCRHAINVRHKEAYEANYPKTCSRPPCPAVACAYEPAVAAVCRNNRCVGSSSLAGF